MKKTLQALLLTCIALQCNAKESEPLCGSIKEIRKTEDSSYTIVWNEPAPKHAALVLTSSESKKKHLLVTILPIERTLSPEVLPEGHDPFALPAPELYTSSNRHLEMTSQLGLDPSLFDRTIISVYLCSATFSEIEKHYIKKQ